MWFKQERRIVGSRGRVKICKPRPGVVRREDSDGRALGCNIGSVYVLFLRVPV